MRVVCTWCAPKSIFLLCNDKEFLKIQSMKKPFKQRKNPMFKGYFYMVGVAGFEVAQLPLFKGKIKVGVQVVCNGVP